MTDFKPYHVDLLQIAIRSYHFPFESARQTITTLIEHGVQSQDDILKLVKDKSASDDIRIEAITATAWLNNEQHIPMLVNILLDESESSDIRNHVASVARQYDHDDFVQPLIDFIQSMEDDNEQYTAIQSLGNMNKQVSTQFIYDNFIKDGDEDTRLIAIRSIMWGNPTVTDTMIKELVNIAYTLSSPNRIRAMAVEALGELGRDEQVPLYVEMLKDADADVRYEACWSLSMHGKPENIPMIESLLTDTSIPVGATIDHPTVADIAKYAIEEIQRRCPC